MEGESQSEESSSSSSSSSSFLNNFINLMKNSSVNPSMLPQLTQAFNLQYSQILMNLGLDINKITKDQNEFIFNQLLQNFSKIPSFDAKPFPKLEKNISFPSNVTTNDEETSAGSHCEDNEGHDDGKLENIKKNNKKLQKFEEILDKMLLKLKLTNTDEIKSICLDVLNLIIPVLTEHFKNKPFEAVAAAVMVFSCRNANYPITLKEIVSASCEQGKDLTKMINKCVFSLKTVLPEHEFTMKFLNPEEMAKRLIKKLNLDEKVLNYVLKLIKFIEDKNFIKGKHPNTVAACALKIVSILFGAEKEGLSFELLSETAKLNKITLKNTYRELHMHSVDILNEMKSIMEFTVKELPNL